MRVDLSGFCAGYFRPYDQWYLSNERDEYLSGGRVVDRCPEYFNTRAEADEELTRLKEKSE